MSHEDGQQNVQELSEPLLGKVAELERRISLELTRLQRPKKSLQEKITKLFDPHHNSLFESVDQVLFLKTQAVSEPINNRLDTLLSSVTTALGIEGENASERLSNQIVAWKWNRATYTYTNPLARTAQFIESSRPLNLRFVHFLPEKFTGNWDNYSPTDYTVYLLSMIAPRQFGYVKQVTESEVQTALAEYQQSCEQHETLFEMGKLALDDWKSYLAEQGKQALESYSVPRNIILLSGERFREQADIYEGKSRERSRAAAGHHVAAKNGGVVVINGDVLEKHPLYNPTARYMLVSHEIAHEVRSALQLDNDYTKTRAFEEGLVQGQAAYMISRYQPELHSHYMYRHDSYPDEVGLVRYNFGEPEDLFFTDYKKIIEMYGKKKNITGPLRKQAFLRLLKDTDQFIDLIDTAISRDVEWTQIRQMFEAFNKRWNVTLIPRNRS